MLPSQQLKGHWITNTLNILGAGNNDLVFWEYLAYRGSPPAARVPLFVAKQIYCNAIYVWVYSQSNI